MEKFSKTLHGYNPKEVNAFLDEVIIHVDKLVKEKNFLVKEIKEKDLLVSELNSDKKELLDHIARYQNIEMTMNKAIVAAQDSGEQIRQIARQERDMIINEARSNANRIVSDALIRAEKTEIETVQLRKNITVFKRRLRSIIESQLEVVDDIETLDL